ncbi:hypothetical protein [Streptomyces sp. NBC_00557]|uniref:hypothetical protein n=1 Tax=Streptomyces sp. NBC_00557 TaxID=2975776 RepID=UPI002E7FBB68|nr:hypothetical protein [Streptomyces sp. NBC_00557]WUC32830.1 hypothetical protein OG956_00615 [Streptomyces sp. NBC_00557]
MSDPMLRSDPPPAVSRVRPGGSPPPGSDRPVGDPVADEPFLSLPAGTGDVDPAESHIVRGID